jgi:hypothetical protein
MDFFGWWEDFVLKRARRNGCVRAIFEVQVVALEDQVLIRLVMMASMLS